MKNKGKWNRFSKPRSNLTRLKGFLDYYLRLPQSSLMLHEPFQWKLSIKKTRQLRNHQNIGLDQVVGNIGDITQENVIDEMIETGVTATVANIPGHHHQSLHLTKEIKGTIAVDNSHIRAAGRHVTAAIPPLNQRNAIDTRKEEVAGPGLDHPS